jgi:hypothetical protein
MPECETCGNLYDKTFEILQDGSRHTFDCFECAVQALAPTCEACGVRILGHGHEIEDHMFCSSHCAEQKGYDQLRDRA